MAETSMLCRIRVLDAKALGDPGVLGTAEVSLKEAQLQPNAGARNSWLPLKVTSWSCCAETHLLLEALLEALTWAPVCRPAESHIHRLIACNI